MAKIPYFDSPRNFVFRGPFISTVRCIISPLSLPNCSINRVIFVRAWVVASNTECGKNKTVTYSNFTRACASGFDDALKKIKGIPVARDLP